MELKYKEYIWEIRNDFINSFRGFDFLFILLFPIENYYLVNSTNPPNFHDRNSTTTVYIHSKEEE